jgi:hypothetical protein
MEYTSYYQVVGAAREVGNKTTSRVYRQPLRPDYPDQNPTERPAKERLNAAYRATVVGNVTSTRRVHPDTID